MHVHDVAVKSEDTWFDGVPVRVYTPRALLPHPAGAGARAEGEKGSTELSAGLVYFHGGGWVAGNRGRPTTSFPSTQVLTSIG